MPFIGNGRMLEDGSIFTSYQGTAWNQIQTYYFTETQDGIYVKNIGQNPLTINGNVMQVGQFINFTNIAQFTAVADGRESFEVQAWSGGPVNSATEAIKTLYSTAAGKKWLDNVAENQRDGKATNIVCAIDSLTASNSYLDSARDLLQNYMGNGGLGFVGFGNAAILKEGMQWGRFGAAGGVVESTNANFNPAVGDDTTFDPNLYHVGHPATIAGSWADVTFKGTSLDTVTLMYLKQPLGGSLTFKDGGSVTDVRTIQTVNATKAVGFETRPGWNTLPNQVMRVSFEASKISQAIGFNLQLGTGGVRMHRVAQPGSKVSQLAALDAVSYQAFLQNIGCDLYILLAGMNDAPGDNATVYEANMRKVLDNVKAANPKAAILLLAINETDTPSKNVVLQTYIDTYQKLAADYGAMIWDERLVLGSYAQALAAGLMADGTHPNVTGSSMRAESIVKFLGGTALADIRKALIS